MSTSSATSTMSIFKASCKLAQMGTSTAGNRGLSMRTKRLMVTSVLLFGSLWGLAELGLARLDFSVISTAPLLTAAGIFFLVLSRQVCDIPGSSLLLGTLAAGFKFLNQPFFGCQFAAVLVLAAVFELLFTSYQLWERNGARQNHGMLSKAPIARAAAAAFLSFSAFVLFARFGLQNPFWIDCGLGKLVRFTVLEGSAAALLAVPAAWAALRLATHLLEAEKSWDTTRWLAFRLAALGSGAAGVVVALTLR